MTAETIDNKISSIVKSIGVLQGLCMLAVLTVSFDIFLVLNLGFNFRATQILLFIPIAAVIADGLMTRRWAAPPGLVPLLIWTIFIIAFIPNSGYLARGAAYGFWLIFNVLTVITVSRIFYDWEKSTTLLKFYILSYVFVAGFGILQFMLPLVRIRPPLVTQWWFDPYLARVNGFSYEPSYFSSYLLMGWVLVAWLMKKELFVLRQPVLYGSFWIITISLILSSSRMGWILMILWAMHYPLQLVARMCRGYLNIAAFKVTTALAGVALLGFVAVVNVVGADKLLFLVNGLGIAGTAAHSQMERTNQLGETFSIFLNSPINGYSLGGVAPAIGELRGVEVTDNEIAKENEGMSIFVEVLAGSGIFGFVPFLVYMATIFRAPLKLARRTGDQAQSVVLQGMVISLLFELLILQMNQNILRPYLWMHIAILSAICISVKRSCTAAA